MCYDYLGTFLIVFPCTRRTGTGLSCWHSFLYSCVPEHTLELLRKYYHRFSILTAIPKFDTVRYLVLLRILIVSVLLSVIFASLISPHLTSMAAWYLLYWVSVASLTRCLRTLGQIEQFEMDGIFGDGESRLFVCLFRF